MDGTRRRFPWGDDEPSPEHASFNSRVNHATPVGIYPRGLTPEGVADLAGNVFEWCSDRFGPYPADPSLDPTGAGEGQHRVLRGGSFHHPPDPLRAAYRNTRGPGLRLDDVGFRVVWLSPEDS